ncbi:MAG: glycosyltransferase family 4 protein [Chitinophagales bacterium]|nr:glycosyltransferase family 4 protein [Chitinophagales bacterium]MCZ2393956.1 glycosyltransferase family 4 protein [Chitinophagales bacterium]
MKRIGIIANTSWNLLNFRLGLIRAIEQAGHKIVLIAPKDEHSQELERLGFHVQYVKGLSRKGTNPLADLLLIFELAKIYRNLKLDVVLQYTIKPNIYGSIAGYLTGITTICTVTGLGYVFLNKGISSTIAKVLYQFAFKFSHLIYFQNADDKLLFEQTGLVSIHKSRLVNGSGIDTNYFHPNFCNTIHKEKGITTFLMIARLLKDKGVYEYISAAKNIAVKYHNSRFILLGDQDNGNPAAVNEKDIELWKEENIIEITGFKKNIREYICQADAVVLPSYREGIPRVILEAFAMGKPCITTDAPGCRHTVDDKINGLICKVADSKELEIKLEDFILMKEEEKTLMGNNARQKALNTYSIDLIAKEYLTLIDNL